MFRKELGKISSVQLGFGGYEDAQFGISLSFSGSGWSVQTFENLDEEKVKGWLINAKVKTLDKLVNIPVEIEFKDYNVFNNFRILTEVL